MGKTLVKLKMYKTKIPSDINIICPTIYDILCYISDNFGSVSDDTEFEIKVVLNELILNAIKHGNREIKGNFVKIAVAITEENKILIIVEDEGQGYNYSYLLNDEPCPVNDADLLEMKVSGRGLLIVTNLCERVRFNKKGNRIMIVKKLISV
jgi:serine/threonine-protein kinase RsbW